MHLRTSRVSAVVVNLITGGHRMPIGEAGMEIGGRNGNVLRIVRIPGQRFLDALLDSFEGELGEDRRPAIRSEWG